MSTTKLVLNPITGLLDVVTDKIDLSTDVVGLLPVANMASIQYPNEYWVHCNSGDDTTGDGSFQRPWKTVAFAAATSVGNALLHLTGFFPYDQSTGPITLRPNTLLIADYPGFGISQNITISPPSGNSLVIMQNLTCSGAITWVENTASAIQLWFLDTEIDGDITFQQNGAGAPSSFLWLRDSVAINIDATCGQISVNDGGLFGTLTYNDSGSSFLIVNATDITSTVNINGGVTAYFMGCNADGYSIVAATTGSGTPHIIADSGSLPPPGSITGSFTTTFTSYLDYINGTIDLTSQVTGVLPEANGGTAQSTYATGDILYASATNTLSKLAASTDGYVLTQASGVPTWAPGGSGGSANYVVSSSCGNFSTTNATFTDVTNLSVTITTTGRPVVIGIVADGDNTVGHEAQIIANANTGDTTEAYYAILEGSTIIATHFMTMSNTGITSGDITVPSSSLNHSYTPGAGTYTYKVQIHRGTGTSAQLRYSKLVAYELGATPAGGNGPTPYTSYTPTVTGVGTISSLQFLWSVNNDLVSIRGYFTCGTPSASTLTVSLPNGYTIASTELDTNSILQFGMFNVAQVTLSQMNTSGGGTGVVTNNGTSNTEVAFAWRNQTNAYVLEGANGFVVSGNKITFQYSFIKA